MKIEVTQEHIDSGGRLSSNCPIALALKQAGLKNFSVWGSAKFTGSLLGLDLGKIILGGFEKPWQTGCIRLPYNATEFIEVLTYLGKSKARPFSFNVSAECFML